MLVSMKYKSFIWPINPKTYEVEYQRSMRRCKIPFADDWTVQDMGSKGRIFRGEGEFAGDRAYEYFRRLAEVFNEGGHGVLYHPVWGRARACFTKLTMREEPREDYVSYSFEFTEIPDDPSYYDDSFDDSLIVARLQAKEGRIRYVPAESDDTYYSIAAMNDISVPRLLELNPWIEDPDDPVTTDELIKV